MRVASVNLTFDLVIPINAVGRYSLRLITYLLGCPRNKWATRYQENDDLIASGFEKFLGESGTIIDVCDHDLLQRRDGLSSTVSNDSYLFNLYFNMFSIT